MLVSRASINDQATREEEIFRATVFGGDTELRSVHNLHRSTEPLVPIALTFSTYANIPIRAERTLKGVADLLGVEWRFPNRPGDVQNFVLIYSMSPPQDIIVQYPAIRKLLSFDAEDERLVAARTAFKVEDGAIVENPCIVFTRWKPYTVSRTFLIVDIRQPAGEIDACFLRAASSHLGLGSEAFDTLRAELVDKNGRMNDTLRKLLTHLYSNAVYPEMTEQQAMSAFHADTPASEHPLSKKILP